MLNFIEYVTKIAVINNLNSFQNQWLGFRGVVNQKNPSKMEGFVKIVNCF